MNTDVPYSKAGLVSMLGSVTRPQKGGVPVHAGRVVSNVLSSHTLRKPNSTVLYHKLLVASMQKCPHRTKMIEQTEK